MTPRAVCSHCGFSIQSEAVACARCGHVESKLSVATRYGTFLFCDLVGSTRLIVGSQPEAQLRLMQLVRTTIRDVPLHGGQRERFDGDGYFISFTSADSSESDAVIAMRVGLEVAEAIRSAGERAGRDLNMRVGIASGSVIVGYKEDTTVVPDAGYIGAAVNLARRLADAAPPGRVLVAEETRRLAGGFFDYERVSGLGLAGFDEDLEAWLVAGRSEIASRYLASQPAAPEPLFGRDTELRVASESWQRCLSGHRVALQLIGDAGIGKSSLAHGVRLRATQAGAFVLDLDCTPRTSHTPFYPLAVLLRRLAGVPSLTTPADAARQVEHWIVGAWGDDALRELQPHLPLMLMQAVEPDSHSDQEVARATAAIVETVHHRSETAPILVCAEDVHWADAATSGLLTRLASDPRRGSVMVLTTTRKIGASELAAGQVTLDLEPLDDDSARRLIRRCAGQKAIDDAAVDRLVRLADGNPLYLEIMARTGNASGGLGDVLQGGAPLPPALMMLMQSLVDRAPQMRSVVQAAAVLGREFHVSLLDCLLGDARLAPEDIEQMVDDGIWERRQTPGGEAGLRFRHALIQEAVYRSMMASDRRSLHLRAAQMLRTRFEHHPGAIEEIVGSHLASAGREGEAAECYLRAADSARARGAFLDAEAHCREGTKLAARVTVSEQRRHILRQLHTLRAIAMAATKGYAADEVEAAYDHAYELCEEGDDPAALFPIVRGRGTFVFVRGRFGEAQTIATECMELAHLSGRQDHLIEALSFLGYTELYLGRVDAARKALDACIERYHASSGERYVYPSPQDAGTSALSLLGTVAWLQGDCVAAERAAVEAVENARRRARPIDEAYTLVWLAMQRNLQRRYALACELADASIAISERHGFGTWYAAARMQRHIACCAADASPETVDRLRTELGGFMMAGAMANASYFEWGAAQGAVRAGDRGLALACVERAMALSQASGEAYLRAELLIVQAHLADDEEDSLLALRQAFELAASQGAYLLALRAAVAHWERRAAGDAESALLIQARALLDSGGDGDLPADGWAREAVAGARQLML